MTLALSTWIAEHGYVALAVGGLLEGETVLLLAGAAAHNGLLEWPFVFAIGALVAFTSDTLLFALGRWQSPRIYSRWPALRERVRPRIDRWLERHAGLTVVCVRFAYGLRTAGPLVLGTSSLPWSRFIAFSALAALLWAGIVTSLGTALGTAVAGLLQASDRLDVGVLLSAALVLALVAGIGWQRLAPKRAR